MEHMADDTDGLCYAMLYLKSELYAKGLKETAALVGNALDMAEKELSSTQVDVDDFKVFRDFIEKALKLDKKTLSNLVTFLAHDDKELAC